MSKITTILPSYDVVAVNNVTRRVRFLAVRAALVYAEAIVSVAAENLGVSREFFKTVPSGTYVAGCLYLALNQHARRRLVPHHTGEFSVRGVGRVGSYFKACARKRSRSRRYWVVQELLAKVREEKSQDLERGISVTTLITHETREDLGRFKTKAQAIQCLVDYAKVNGLTLEGKLDGYPRLYVPSGVMAAGTAKV